MGDHWRKLTKVHSLIQGCFIAVKYNIHGVTISNTIVLTNKYKAVVMQESNYTQQETDWYGDMSCYINTLITLLTVGSILLLTTNIKDTKYVWGKNSSNQQLLDIMAHNSAVRVVTDGLTDGRTLANVLTDNIINKKAWASTYLPHSPIVQSLCPKDPLWWWIETHTNT